MTGKPKEFQSIVDGLGHVGSVKSLQDSLANVAHSLTPAIDAFRNSLGSLGTASVINDMHGTIGGARQLNEIRNAALVNKDRWDHISRSFEAIDSTRMPPIEMPRITPISEHLEKALKNQDRRQEIYRREQATLLSDIASAGREQNQTMIAFIKLQETLVNESLENSRVQRVVLIFSAASVLLSLFALIATK